MATTGMKMLKAMAPNACEFLYVAHVVHEGRTRGIYLKDSDCNNTALLAAIRGLDYGGVTGRVRFDASCDRVPRRSQKRLCQAPMLTI